MKQKLHTILLQVYKRLPVPLRFLISYLHSDKFVVGITAIIKHGDEILLTKNSYQYSWALPGGFLTRGESFQESVIREIDEEMGIKVLIERVIEVNTIKTRPIVDVFILCHYQSGTIKPDLVEIEKARFFPLDKLPKRILPIHRKYIEKYKMV